MLKLFFIIAAALGTYTFARNYMWFSNVAFNVAGTAITYGIIVIAGVVCSGFAYLKVK